MPGAAAGRLLPGARALFDPAGPYLLPLLLLIAARVVMWRMLPFASEDAYITFRYARNFAGGHGLVFNPGEHVMGFTSPLWTMWLAVGVWLFHDPLPWARLSALIADLGTALVLGRMLEQHVSRAAAGTFTTFFAAWPFFAMVAMSGMESTPMLGWIVLTAALVGAGHPLAGPALGALALWRPEGVACAAVLALGARPRDRIVALLVAAAGLAALAGYFGSPLPQSVIAKSTLYGTPGPWVGRHWWEWLVPFPLGRWPSNADTTLMAQLALLFSASLCAALPVVWKLRRTPLALALAAALVVWLGYAALGVAYFYWYFAIPLAGLAGLAAAGFPRIVRHPALYVVCALHVLGIWLLAPQLYVGRAQNEFHAFARAGEWLRNRSVPGESVFLEPIGFVGWLAPLRVIDETGLVSPAVAKRRLEGAGWYADVVRQERPDWIVVRAGVLSAAQAFAGQGAPFRDLAERDSTVAHYARETTLEEEAGANALLILRRVR